MTSKRVGKSMEIEMLRRSIGTRILRQGAEK